jgi:hypothetical protein
VPISQSLETKVRGKGQSFSERIYDITYHISCIKGMTKFSIVYPVMINHSFISGLRGPHPLDSYRLETQNRLRSWSNQILSLSHPDCIMSIRDVFRFDGGTPRITRIWNQADRSRKIHQTNNVKKSKLIPTDGKCSPPCYTKGIQTIRSGRFKHSLR